MKVCAFIFPFFFAWNIWAADASLVVKGGVISEDGAYVFVKPDFDSEVITTLPPGSVYYISKDIYKKAFFKIKVKQGVMGYVSTADIKPLSKKDQKTVEIDEKIQPKAKEEKGKDNSVVSADSPKKEKTFEFQRFWGPQLASIDFQEDTMGSSHHEAMNFYGVKFSGGNLVISGESQTDISLLIAPTVPGYYEKATGTSGNGFVFLGSVMFESYWPQTPNWMNYFGFGPMIKYSRFDIELKDSTTGKNAPFTMEDIAVGATIHGGMAFRIGRMALRVEAQYFYESQPYFGFSLAPQFTF